MSIRSKALAIGSILILSATSMHATDVDQDQKIIDLDTYTISANKIALPVGSVGSSITVLNAEDTARFSTEMVTETLRHVPGLYLRNNGGIGATAGITMRGLPLAPVVLIDGVEVNNPGSGDVFNFGNLPTAMIDSIEVLRGAQSALYGANALTGVVSVHTKKGETVEPSMLAGFSYGSRETVSGYATLSQATELVNYFVSVNYRDTGGYSAQDRSFGPEWADDDSASDLNIMGKMEVALTDKIDWTFLTTYLDAESEYDPGTPSKWSTPVMDNYMERERNIVKTALEMNLLDFFRIDASVGYHKTSELAVDAYGERDSEAELLKWELLAHLQLNDVYQVVAGVDYEHASDKIGDFEIDTFSAYIEHLIEVVPNLNLSLAARYDDDDTFDLDSTYRGSLSYLMEGLGLQLKASYGTSYDAPEISQLFGTWGNPDLIPEDGSSYDFGFEHELLDGSFIYGVTYFSVVMEDHIEFLKSTDRRENVDWDSQGVEAFVRYDAANDLSIQLGYSLAKAERKRVEDDQIYHSPENQISLMLDKGFLDNKFKTSITVLYVGDRETWDGATDRYITVDIATRYQVNKSTELWLRADNLLDEEYQEIRGYFAPGLGVFAGLNYQF